VVRAINEHSFLYEGGKRLYYIGPMFRHERPQKGRYRQFHQVGAEVLGFSGPDVDAELILMSAALWRDLGLEVGTDVKLEINSLGQPEERRAHREALIKHFEAHAELLDEEARRRLHSNPLRILDTKNPAMQGVVEAAPQLIEFLGEASLAHLGAIQQALDAAGIGYRVNPRLVRGMDYYNLTVFEWVTDRLGSQGTVCGGGRYDGLVEQLGGKPAPAVGWGLGIERLLLLIEAVGKAPEPVLPDAFAIALAGAAPAQFMPVLESLRAQGVTVLLNPAGKDGPASPKSQFKKADASGARFALVFGPDELANGQVAIKPLRDGGQQRLEALADVSQWAASLR
jgi:histidyl-tRNA synthetase